jgi:predicted  nucleic acid-binding Zn-ribbon protein
MAGILPKRDEAWKALLSEYRGHYEELRRKKRAAVVNVVEDICQVCHMQVPPQWIMETRMLRAVHTCPGCTGYLLP